MIEKQRLYRIKEVLDAGDFSVQEKLQAIQGEIASWDEQVQCEHAEWEARLDYEWRYRHGTLPGRLVDWLKEHPGQHTSAEIATESSLERSPSQVAAVLGRAEKKWGNVKCEKCRCGKARLFSYKEADDGTVHR